IAMINLDDVEDGTRELERAARLGLAGAMITEYPAEDRRYDQPEYERFWAAAAALDLPLSLHTATRRQGKIRGAGPGTLRDASSRLRDVIGVDNMMWGSDYPHSESTFPQSRKILAEILAGVPEDEQAKIAGGNTARVYNFDVARLTVPGEDARLARHQIAR